MNAATKKIFIGNAMENDYTPFIGVAPDEQRRQCLGIGVFNREGTEIFHGERPRDLIRTWRAFQALVLTGQLDSVRDIVFYLELASRSMKDEIQLALRVGGRESLKLRRQNLFKMFPNEQTLYTLCEALDSNGTPPNRIELEEEILKAVGKGIPKTRTIRKILEERKRRLSGYRSLSVPF